MHQTAVIHSQTLYRTSPTQPHLEIRVAGWQDVATPPKASVGGFVTKQWPLLFCYLLRGWFPCTLLDVTPNYLAGLRKSALGRRTQSSAVGRAVRVQLCQCSSFCLQMFHSTDVQESLGP